MQNQIEASDCHPVRVLMHLSYCDTTDVSEIFLVLVLKEAGVHGSDVCVNAFLGGKLLIFST